MPRDIHGRAVQWAGLGRRFERCVKVDEIWKTGPLVCVLEDLMALVLFF